MVMESRSKLRLLLLQIRRSDSVRSEERRSFAAHAGLNESQIDVHNVFEEPRFGPEIVDGYDALFVGGASDASVLQPEHYPFVNEAESLLQWCVEKDFPVFASCFGFQLAVIALGGRIVRDEKDFEFGTIPIRLTAEASKDDLFRDVPDPFLAVSGHKEKALSLPDSCTLLARTDICAHSFRVDSKRFWAFQFHPELDRRRLIDRLSVYKDQYVQNDDDYQDVIRAFRETPDSNGIVRKFIDRVLL